MLFGWFYLFVGFLFGFCCCLFEWFFGFCLLGQICFDPGFSGRKESGEH